MPIQCTAYIVRVSKQIIYQFLTEFEYLIYYLLDVKFLKVNITYKYLKKAFKAGSL